MCITSPTASFTDCHLLKDWWPHSWATTHTPVQTAPCTAGWSAQLCPTDTMYCCRIEFDSNVA